MAKHRVVFDREFGRRGRVTGPFLPMEAVVGRVRGDAFERFEVVGAHEIGHRVGGRLVRVESRVGNIPSSNVFFGML